MENVHDALKILMRRCTVYVVFPLSLATRSTLLIHISLISQALPIRTTLVTLRDCTLKFQCNAIWLTWLNI